METIMGQLMTPVATKMFLAMKQDVATPEFMPCIGRNLRTLMQRLVMPIWTIIILK
jgi:hypothetical protein